MSISKPNADETLRAERDAEELKLVAAELADGTPKVAKLRLMLDPKWSPILAKPIWTLLPPTLVNLAVVFLIMYASNLSAAPAHRQGAVGVQPALSLGAAADTFLTAVVFTVVVAFVVVLLAFVNGRCIN